MDIALVDTSSFLTVACDIEPLDSRNGIPRPEGGPKATSSRSSGSSFHAAADYAHRWPRDAGAALVLVEITVLVDFAATGRRRPRAFNTHRR